MRILLSTLLVAVATAFQPIQTPQRVATKLEVARRDVLVTIVGGVLAPAAAANALSHGMQNREGSHTHGSTWFFDENIENVREESQMPTGGKLDLNGATVNQYMQFPGMYPRAAGLIASNGPYNTVQDIYKIKGINANDKNLFKKYEKEFTVNPPGRMFDERINQRQST